MDVYDTCDYDTLPNTPRSTPPTVEYSIQRQKYFQEGQGFLLVYDITSAASFDYLQDIYQE